LVIAAAFSRLTGRREMKERKLILIKKWRADLIWSRDHARSMKSLAPFYKDAWWDGVK